MNPWDDDRIAANGKPVKDNFAAWFAGSKVVSTTLEPLVVYHGTARNFLAFDPQAEGIDGIYFSSSTAIASEYAAWRHEFEGEGGGNIVPVYLVMHNPRIVNGMQDFVAESMQDEVDRAKAAGHDGLIVRGIRDGYSEDGGPVADTYVAFRSEQIKSAIGNAGLYLSNSSSLTDLNEAWSLARVQTAWQVAQPPLSREVQP